MGLLSHLLAASETFHSNIFFFVMCAARTEAASRLPVGVNVGYVKQPRSLLFSTQAPYIAVASQPCTPSLQVSAFFEFIFFIAVDG